MYSRWLRNAHQIDLYDFYYGDSDKKEKEEEPEDCPYSGCPGTGLRLPAPARDGAFRQLKPASDMRCRHDDLSELFCSDV